MWNRLYDAVKGIPEASFWRWFTEHEEAYRNFEVNGPEQDRLFGEMDRALHRVHKGLQFVFDSGGSGTRKLVISADGMRDLIPVVQRLMAAAPELPGWKFTAFRPRMTDVAGVTLHIGVAEIGMSDLWFALRSEGDRIGLDIYLPGVVLANQDQGYTIAFLMLDTALGEYDVMTRVGSLEIHPLPPDPEQRNLKPFPTLAGEFDAYYRLITER